MRSFESCDVNGVGDEGDTLQGLSETHFVSEDAVDAPVIVTDLGGGVYEGALMGCMKGILQGVFIECVVRKYTKEWW